MKKTTQTHEKNESTVYVILGNNLEYIITRYSINFCKGIQFVFSFFRPRTSQSELRAFDIIQKYWNALFFILIALIYYCLKKHETCG